MEGNAVFPEEDDSGLGRLSVARSVEKKRESRQRSNAAEEER
jgi:hypothetical protein